MSTSAAQAWPSTYWAACSWEAHARLHELAAVKLRRRDHLAAEKLTSRATMTACRPLFWAKALRDAGFTEAEIEAELTGVLERAQLVDVPHREFCAWCNAKPVVHVGADYCSIACREAEMGDALATG